VFLLDLLGHRDDDPVAEAIEEARGVSLWLRVLGSYPRWTGTRA
jgi:prephenate dehydratase